MERRERRGWIGSKKREGRKEVKGEKGGKLGTGIEKIWRGRRQGREMGKRACAK